MGRRTVLTPAHLRAGARLIQFAGWDLPIHYSGGIREEHVATRSAAGLFDVSHMGRFLVRGPGAAALLDGALTSCVQALLPGRGQYTILPTETGGARDDAFLYNLGQEDYLLVVNAANRDADMAYLQDVIEHVGASGGVEVADISEETAMVSIQGPASLAIASRVLDAPALAQAARNDVVVLSRSSPLSLFCATGYTGEPKGAEIILDADGATSVWDLLAAAGGLPCGLGARDSLRLEAGLPLYGHELGQDADGDEIPLFAVQAVRSAVCTNAAKADYPGRKPVTRQRAAWLALREGAAPGDALRRLVRCVTLTERGVAREGTRLYTVPQGREAGYVTSGTLVPHGSATRCVALALLDSAVAMGAPLEADIRGKRVAARVVRRHIHPQHPSPASE